MRRHVTRCGVGDQRLNAREAVGDEQRDVAVAPVLAEDRLGVPEDEVRLGRPRQIGMCRGQAAGPRSAARPPPRRPPGQVRGAAHLVRGHDRIAQEAPAAASTAAKRAATNVCRRAISQDDGMAACTSSGLKLKKVEITTSAGTAPMGAAREAKYPPDP